jgi:hypothetical protein
LAAASLQTKVENESSLVRFTAEVDDLERQNAALADLVTGMEE